MIVSGAVRWTSRIRGPGYPLRSGRPHIWRSRQGPSKVAQRFIAGKASSKKPPSRQGRLKETPKGPIGDFNRPWRDGTHLTDSYPAMNRWASFTPSLTGRVQHGRCASQWRPTSWAYLSEVDTRIRRLGGGPWAPNRVRVQAGGLETGGPFRKRLGSSIPTPPCRGPDHCQQGL